MMAVLNEFFNKCDLEVTNFDRLSVENSELVLSLAKAATWYIRETPCDPDITDDQIIAWAAYQCALEDIESKR